MTPSLSADRRRQFDMLSDIRDRAMRGDTEAMDVIEYAKGRVVGLGLLWAQQDRINASMKANRDKRAGGVMNRQCETCAFGKTGGAADEVTNTLKAEICSLGAIPFFCHHGRDGSEYDWQADPLGPMALPPAQRKLCAGWQQRVRKLHTMGYFGEYRSIRRVVARIAEAALEEFLKKDGNLHKKHKAQMRVERCLKFLVKRDIAKERIPL